MNSKARGIWAAVLVCMSVSLAARAQVVPRVRTVSEKAFQHPNLFVPEVTEDLTMLPAPRRPAAASDPGLVRRSCRSRSSSTRGPAGPTSVILRQPVLLRAREETTTSRWTAG